MKYLKRFELKPRSKLFPDIPVGMTEYRSDTFSKNSREALQDGNVQHETAMRLVGWPDRSRGKSVQLFYGNGYSMSLAAQEIEKGLYSNIQDVLILFLIHAPK